MRNKTIQYAIDGDTGLIVSRVGDEVCYLVLDYKAIGKDGDYTAPLTYYMEKEKAFKVLPHMHNLTWTRKIPIEQKNFHRVFWGMNPLR
jgi:hypothetical protein